MRNIPLPDSIRHRQGSKRRGGSCTAALLIGAKEHCSAEVEESWLFQLPKDPMVYQNITTRLNKGTKGFVTLNGN